jgi:lipoprotein NlpD
VRWVLLGALTGMLCGCGNYHAPAPVINAWLEPEAQTADYIVSKGDTIYSIAWQFGLDYRTLAQANHLKSPYSIYQGQRLKMTTTARGAVKPPRPANPEVSPSPEKRRPSNSPVLAPAPATAWQWPAVGKLMRGYSPSLTGNAGINIAGRLGSPVRAGLSGEIVYSGDGIRGYGNLIIIKHNRHYLSAYAYNQKILVKLGQQVHTGEQIATMGRDDAGQVMLHFEIRYDGRPVDPMGFLS